MNTCYLFLEQLITPNTLNEPTTNNCDSLVCDDSGQLMAPAITRSFSEIKTLQQGTKTIIVLATKYFSLFKVELPLLAVNKARAAIPFALEDQVTQNIESLHFAFANHYYQDGAYLVVVVDKLLLTSTIEWLKAQGILIDALTIDWFALNPGEIWLLQDYVLINNPLFCGALTYDLAHYYLNKLAEDQQLSSFADLPTIPPVAKKSINLINEPSVVVISQRLQQTKFINLCQGSLQLHSKNQWQTNRGLQAIVLLSIVWLVSFFGVNGLKIHTLNQENKILDQQIKIIYYEFFPHATQVISPKFRIMQLLKTDKQDQQSIFWLLLAKLSMALTKSDLIVNELNFNRNILTVKLTSKNFASLEKLQDNLQKNGIKIKARATTSDDLVLGNLELSD